MNTGSIIEVINVTREAAWLPWAVQYFFLIGISVGAFVLTLPAFMLGRADWEKVARLALLVALACGLAAPVALLSDLHQPNRFYHFYLYFTPGSWMSWGSFFLPAYIVALLGYAWAIYRPDMAAMANGARGPSARLYRLAGGPGSTDLVRRMGMLTLALALLVALYTGAEVMVVKARVLWNTLFLPPQFLLTGLAGAVGLALIFNYFLGDRDTRVEVQLNGLLAVALGLVMLFGLLWLAAGMAGLDRAAADALALVNDPYWYATAVWAALATVIPFALALWRPQGSGLVNGLIAVHSAWMFRWTVFMGGQAIPKTGAGLYEYALPLGPDGWLGILGTAGLWLFLVILLILVLPWRGATSALDVSTRGTLAEGARP